jgi:acetyltransferase
MPLDQLFSPRSIAIIGASTKPGTVGWTLTENIVRSTYSGKVYPVNPKADTLFDLPCYKDVSEIPDAIELAIIIVPAAAVPSVLRAAGSKGAKAAIIISAGFKETGDAGRKLEEEVSQIAREHDMALLGPNCLGFLHPKINLNASFAKRMPKDGTTAFFSQSGALCTALLDLAGDTVGFSHFVSDGNKAVLGEQELLRYFADDEALRTIAFYTEGLADGESIIRIGRDIIREKDPKAVIALKSGTTAAGAGASSSHTGSLAGSDEAYRALFRQGRMLRAEDLEHLLQLITAFSKNPLPDGNRLAIVTNAGGLGVLATDAAIKNGLVMSKLSQETEATLRAALPAAASSHNPVDVLGDALADRYQAALDAVAADEQADMILVIVTPQTMTEAKKTAEAIALAKERTRKPMIAIFSGDASLADGTALLAERSVACFQYPEAGARACAALAQVSSWHKSLVETRFSFSDIDRDKAAAIFAEARKDDRTALSETEAYGILEAYGFPLLRSRFVQSPEETKKAAEELGTSVALKIVSPDITHKSDAGGVILDIAPGQADSAYERLMTQVKSRAPRARLEGALVVEMARAGGREIILGMKKEPGLGNLIMAGLGGIYVETFKDVSFRFSPLTREDAFEMIHELQTFPLLSGTRGKQGVDIVALESSIGRLSRLIEDFPEIEELDINPLLSFPDASDFRVLDARIRISKS